MSQATPVRRKKSCHLRCWWDCRKNTYVFTKLAVRQMLQIRDRKTINEHCAYLGVGDAPISTSEIVDLYLMNCWIRLGYGAKHGRPTFLKLRRTGMLAQAFQEYGIDINQKIQEIKEAIEHEQRSANPYATYQQARVG